MRSTLTLRTLMLLLVLGLLAGACAAEEEPAEEAAGAGTEAAGAATDPVDGAATETGAMTEGAGAMTEGAMTEGAGAMTEGAMTEGAATGTEAAAGGSASACDAEAITAAVQGGDEAGTLEGMAEAPVATAASNNPVLTTLTQAVEAAGLTDTLNSAEALTVFAPTDCAFAELDQATMDAAMADPEGLLTDVLGYHVIVGEQIASADLSGEYTTFTDKALTVDGTTVAGQAEIVVPDIQTANATVHLIDAVLMPASVGGGEAGASAAPTEG